MKKMLLPVLGLFLFSISLSAQAPQAVCYQAIAKDNQGADLIGQDISIRASIVRGNPTGVVEWEEIHTPTTDQFGLFTLNIGEGSNTGNGAQADFADIDWGNGVYWLRIEMDPFGGMNFDLMGATRIISVPYAIHSNTAGHAASADVADVANFADTANVANLAINALSADVAHFADTSNVANIALNAMNAETSMVSQTTLQAINSDTALYTQVAATALDDDDRDPKNEIQTLQLDGDTLQLVDAAGDVAPGASIVLGDNSSTNELQELEFNNGVISISGGNSINLTTSQMFGAPGASADFPQGILGTNIVLLDQLYTVPNGKTLFVTAGSPNMKIQGYGFPGAGFIVHPTAPNMPIFPAGTQISECFCTGLLIDESPIVTPVIIDLTTTAGYSVPEGKTLFVKSGIPNDLPGRLIIDDQEMEFFRPNLSRGSRIITLPENVLLKKPALYSEMVLTGYLISTN